MGYGLHWQSRYLSNPYPTPIGQGRQPRKGDGPPTTTNSVATAINNILKALIEGAGTDAIVALIVADIPWLASPWLIWIPQSIVAIFGKYFYTVLANFATGIVIDFESGIEASQSKNSMEQLQVALDSGDPTAIATATTNAKNAFGSLIHWDESAPA